MKLFLLLLIVSQVAVLATSVDISQYTPVLYKGTDLKALCAGHEIDLTAWFELETLVEKLNQIDAPQCDEYYRTALVELLELYHQDKDNICSTQKAWEIENYYKTYLTHDNTPKYLVKFLVTYGLQVSGHCQLNMVNTFLGATRNLLTRNDFLELEQWTGKNGPIANLLEAIVKPGGILLPVDLFAVLPDPEQFMQKLAIQTRQSGQIRRAQKVCMRRFMPIYRPVAGPVVALMRAGFDYHYLLNNNDEKTKEYILNELNEWAKVIFLCETLDSVNVYSEVNGAADDEPVRLLTAEEIAELNKDKPDSDINGEELFGRETPVRRVHFQPNTRVAIDNVLVPPNPQLLHLKSSIEAIKGSDDKLRFKLLRRSWQLMKKRFKHGEYKRMFKLIWKKVTILWKSKNKDMTQEKLDLMQSELMDAMEAKEETFVYKVLSPIGKFVKKYQVAIVSVIFLIILFSML